MTGEKYDRQRLPFLRQPSLQFESVQARHGHVQHQAAWLPIRARKKRLGGLESLDRKSLFAQYAGKRLAYPGVIVDEKDGIHRNRRRITRAAVRAM